MDRVPAYEAVDEGSTPPERTIIRCMQQFFMYDMSFILQMHIDI